MAHHLTRTLLCSAAVFALSSQAQAQQATHGSTLQEIVVTARKVEERLQEAPVSVTALTSENLARANIVRIDQIGRAAPSIAINEQAGFPGSILIFMRGIGTVDPILTNDAPVGMYIDGVYLGRVVGALRDLTDVERVEILRGPQGTLFGRNTPGGAISVITKAPSTTFRVSQTLGYASENELNAITTVETGEFGGDANLSARITYRHHQMNGYRRNTAGPKKWGDGSDNIEQGYVALRAKPGNLTLDLKGDWMWRLGVGPIYHFTYISAPVLAYFNNSPNLGGSAFRPTTPIQNQNAGPPATYAQVDVRNHVPPGKLQTYGLSFTGNYDLGRYAQLKSISAYRSMRFWNSASGYAESGFLLGLASTCPNTILPSGIAANVVLGCGVGITPTVQRVDISFGYSSQQVQHQYSQEFQLTGSAGDFKYVAGLYYFKEKVAQQMYATAYIPLPGLGIAPNIAPYNTIARALPNTLIYTGASKSEAGYAQLSYSPSQILDGKLELTGGVRYTKDWKALDQNDSSLVRNLHASFHNLGKLASLKYQATPDLMGYARFSTAYKAGGFSPRAIINGESSTSAYKPELAKAYEVGFKSEMMEHRVRLNADVFLTDYSDYQVNSQTSFQGRLATQVFNAGKIKLTGFEVETTILPAEGVEVNASYGHIKPLIKSFPVALTVPGAVPPQAKTFDVANMLEWQDTPKNTASASVQYSFPTLSNGSTLAFRADWSYQGSRVFYTGASSLRIGANGQPEFLPYGNGVINPVEASRTTPYHEFGAQVLLSDMKIDGASINVIGYVQNITDKHMVVGTVDLTSLGGFTSAWGRGRVFGLQLKAEYP